MNISLNKRGISSCTKWLSVVCDFLSSAYVVSPGPTSQNSFFFFFLSFFHSISDFLGFRLVMALVSGSGSDIPLIQDIEPSNSRALLSHDATLRFFSMVEQCHTKNNYLRCFKSDTTYSGH